jgi:hypothetical protein
VRVGESAAPPSDRGPYRFYQECFSHKAKLTKRTLG